MGSAPRPELRAALCEAEIAARALRDPATRAYAVTRGLPDRERLALGLAVCESVLNPAFHADVTAAAARLRDHGAALADTADTMSAVSSGIEQPGQPVEQPSLSRPAGGDAPALRARAQRSSSPLRRAWGMICRRWRRFEEDRVLLTDLIGALSLFAMLWALLVLSAAVTP